MYNMYTYIHKKRRLISVFLCCVHATVHYKGETTTNHQGADDSYYGLHAELGLNLATRGSHADYRATT